jgi:LysR family glycine cleavage system transcriptional activator
MRADHVKITFPLTHLVSRFTQEVAMQERGAEPQLRGSRSPLARLPSLDLLRGFVAVARRMSITLAADDLFLTQSAVSRQIKGLEDHLGTALFRRSHRAIELTDDGERLFRLADPWFSQLGELLEGMRGRRETAPVTITATVGMTSLWLLPRLGEFQAAHPTVDVRVAAGNRVLDLEREGVELALRYCQAESVPRGAYRLFDEHVIPVASPMLGLHRTRLAETLERVVLLEYEDVSRPWLRWADWLEASRLDKLRPRGHLRFNQYDQVIFAAVAGQGIALGRMPLIAPMLRDGRLVALPDLKPPWHADYAYWLIQRQGAVHEHARILADWLRQAAEETRRTIACCTPETGSGTRIHA